MTTETYNGWTNYATWRVMLEHVGDYFDPIALDDFAGEPLPTVEQLADMAREYVESLIAQTGEGIAADYARAFVSDANFKEMAVGLWERLTDEAREEAARDA